MTVILHQTFFLEVVREERYMKHGESFVVFYLILLHVFCDNLNFFSSILDPFLSL